MEVDCVSEKQGKSLGLLVFGQARLSCAHCFPVLRNDVFCEYAHPNHGLAGRSTNASSPYRFHFRFRHDYERGHSVAELLLPPMLVRAHPVPSMGFCCPQPDFVLFHM